MAAMGGTLHLGTSGFGYDAWMDGVFYPKEVKAAGRLRYYATVFNAVEIHYTFRRFPEESLFRGWRDQVPEGFRFAVKASARITHIKQFANAESETALFCKRAALLGDRLGPVLFRCPDTLPYDRELIARFLDTIPEGVRPVMEFRHPSWAEARDLLGERGVAWCMTENDDLDPTAGDLSWKPFGYLRLRLAEYSDAELAAWAGRIAAALASGSDVYCFFKHEDEAAGPRMALRLAAQVEAAGGVPSS
jgi:uncharacterized protein YecE (DUF72 family)